MFNAVKRPTDAQLRALAADMGVQTPMLGRINVELMAQLVSLMGQWTAAGPHGRVVVERTLKILFETRERFIGVLEEHFPEKAVALMERIRLQDQAAVRAQVARDGTVWNAVEETVRSSPLVSILEIGTAASGGTAPEALTAQSAMWMGHPDLQKAIKLDKTQEKAMREAWAAYLHTYNSRVRKRLGPAVEALEASVEERGAVSSMTGIQTSQAAGNRAVSELESFGRQELYARVSLARRAFQVLKPIQIAYVYVMQLPHMDVVAMYCRILAVQLEDLPEAVRPQLSIYFEEVPQ